MSKIKGILLFPAKGDQHDLLKLGDCGGRPPAACLIGEPYRDKPTWVDGWSDCGRADALVLAWDGDVIQEGLDKAITVTTMLPGGYENDDEVLSQRMFWLDEIVQWVGAALAKLLNCTLVLIDAEGQEITNV